jgi:hypothetical protein
MREKPTNNFLSVNAVTNKYRTFHRIYSSSSLCLFIYEVERHYVAWDRIAKCCVSLQYTLHQNREQSPIFFRLTKLSSTILNFTHDERRAFDIQCLAGGGGGRGGIGKATGRLSVLFFWVQSWKRKTCFNLLSCFVPVLTDKWFACFAFVFENLCCPKQFTKDFNFICPPFKRS